MVINLTSLRESTQKIKFVFVFDAKLANRDYSALICNMKKLIGSESSQSNTLERLASDIFPCLFDLEGKHHVQLKIWFCFHVPFLKRNDMLCKL